MTKVELVYFNAGGGHRAAADALLESIAAQRPRWRVRAVNLFDLLDPKGQFQRITGFAPEAFYNRRLASGFTLGLAQELRILQAMIRAGHEWLSSRLQQHWLISEPDLVVSLVPNFNRAIAHSVAQALPGVPFVTVMTDLADHPPRFWIEPRSAQHVVCGTPRAAEQALAQGMAPSNVHMTSGMILRPSFYDSAPGPAACDSHACANHEAQARVQARAALGLDLASPVGLVMFGGHGGRAMKRIAEHLDDVPLVLMCGHNARLARELRALPAGAPRIVVEFTREVPRWLRLADFFIGKPGPGSVSEALHCGLPVIVTRNAWTMPQERYNTKWVTEQGVGLVIRSFADIRPAVERLLAQLPEMRQRVQGLDNRAVFEVPEILADILATQRLASSAPWSMALAPSSPRTVDAR